MSVLVTKWERLVMGKPTQTSVTLRGEKLDLATVSECLDKTITGCELFLKCSFMCDSKFLLPAPPTLAQMRLVWVSYSLPCKEA